MSKILEQLDEIRASEQTAIDVVFYENLEDLQKILQDVDSEILYFVNFMLSKIEESLDFQDLQIAKKIWQGWNEDIKVWFITSIRNFEGFSEVHYRQWKYDVLYDMFLMTLSRKTWLFNINLIF